MASLPRWRSLLAAGLFLLALAPAVGAQTWRSVTTSRLRSGEEELDVRVRFGAGRLRIHPGDEGILYRMELRYDEDSFEPVARYDESGKLDLGLESVRGKIHWKSKDSQEMTLSLARDLPMDLDLEFGAVKAEVDLGGIRMRSMHLSTGASESRVTVSEPNPGTMSKAGFEVGAADFEVSYLGNLNANLITVDAGVGKVDLDFRGEWRNEATVTIDMGLGALKLRFPEGLGVKLVRDTFLTSLDSEGLVKRGNAYYSLDWETAQRRVTVTVDAAFGSIDVIWLH